MKRWALQLAWALLLTLSSRFAAAAALGEETRYLAIYLPGVYFAQLERKLELGNELCAYLAERLGDGYRLTPRVYADLAPLDADAEAGRIVLGLVESPLVAMRLPALVPVSVATTASGDTRLVVLARPSISRLGGLRNTRLVHAAPLDKPQAFFDNFVFEGELALGSERLTTTRDVASALSLVSLKKADAIVLYEGDEALGQNVGLHALYRTTPLPRPTLVAFDRHLGQPALARLREALGQFQGRVHPGLRTYRATNELPYQALRTRIVERPRRLPGLIDMVEENAPLPLPHLPAGKKSELPIAVFAPPLAATE